MRDMTLIETADAAARNWNWQLLGFACNSASDARTAWRDRERGIEVLGMCDANAAGVANDLAIDFEAGHMLEVNPER